MLNKGYIKTTPYGLGFSELFFEDNLKKYFSDPSLEVLSAEYSPSASDKMAWSAKHPKQGDHPIGVQRYKISFKKTVKYKPAMSSSNLKLAISIISRLYPMPLQNAVFKRKCLSLTIYHNWNFQI